MKLNLNDSFYALLEEVKNSIGESEINSKLDVFANALVEFSANEQRIISVFRILNRIKADIHLRNNVMDLTTYDLFNRITALIEVEIKVTILKLKNPDLIKFDRNMIENELELLNWTENKNDLIALIYGISKSVDNGKASIKKIVRCFEYIFQIDLGNVYDALQNLNIRKEGPCAYLESLSDVLTKKINELNSK